MADSATVNEEERDEEAARAPVQDERPYAFPARVQAVRATAAQLAAVKDLAHDPSLFDDVEPFIFSAVVSTDRYDSYFTRMHESSLKNFARDLEAGISLQQSHNTYQLGLGRSFAGRFTRHKGEKPSRTEGEFYVIPGMNMHGVPTDDVIKGIRGGSLFDVSVGFHSPTYICDLCGEDYLRGACRHWLGFPYGGEEEGEEPKVATATIHDAGLSETSLVYDGATPGAAIQKVVRAVEAGQLEPEKVRALETCYRCKLPGSRHYWAAPDLSERREEQRMSDKNKAAPPEPSGDVGVLQAWQRAMLAALTETGFAIDGKEPASVVREMASEITELRAQRDKVVELEEKVADLTPRAKDGDTYRSDKVDETWGEYVRAGLADGVDEADQKALWQRAPLSQVVRECESYRKLGDARLGGGRQTSEGEPAPPETNGYRRELPLAAYRA